MEPITIFENSPEYYRNHFSNNCKMKLRNISKIKNHIISIKSILEQMDQLKISDDPYSNNFEKITELHGNVVSSLQSFEDHLDNLNSMFNEELQDELSKDFSSILNKNKIKIEEESTNDNNVL